MEKVYNEYEENGIIKTINGMLLLAETKGDKKLIDIISKDFKVDYSTIDKKSGERIYIMKIYNIENIKNSIIKIINQYKEMSKDKDFTNRLYSSVQLLKMKKILGV